MKHISIAKLIREAIEVPSWLKSKLEDVHTKPGQGSIFSKSIDDVLKLAQDALNKEKNIDQIANGTGTLTVKSPGIGYNLVLPIDKARKLQGAQESEVEKIEGPNKIKVPAVSTSAPLDQFKTDEMTIIVRPKKDDGGKVIPNEYIVLSVFPGDPTIPRASEWNEKYAVILPQQNNEVKRMQQLAGLIKEEEKIFKLEIINKNGESTIQTVSVDPKTTELFRIISYLKKSENVRDVKVLEDNK